MTEIVTEACKREGYEMDIEFLPWKRALVDAKVVGTHVINTMLSDAKGDLVWVDPPVTVDIQYLVISKQADGHEAIMAKHGFYKPAPRSDPKRRHAFGPRS